MKKNWKNAKIKTKLTLSYTLMVLLPYLLMLILVGSVFINHVQKNAYEHTGQMIYQVNNYIDLYLMSIEKQMTITEKDIASSPFMHKKSAVPIVEDECASIKANLEHMAMSNAEIAGMMIVNNYDQCIGYNMERISDDPFSDEDWFQTAKIKPNSFQIISNMVGRNIRTDKRYSTDELFSVVKAIKDPNSEQILGVFIIDLSHTILRNAIDRVTLEDGGFIFIANNNKDTIYTPVNDVVYKVTQNTYNSGQNYSSNIIINGQEYHIRVIVSTYTNWRTVGVFSVSELITVPRNLLITLALCSIGIIIMVSLITYSISRSISIPIANLMKLMQYAERGDMTVRFNADRFDEIGQLGQSFNHMVGKINQLIETIFREQTQKRLIELKLLQEQIKPHFLYNTLDTISWLARKHNASDVVAIIDALTSIFRTWLSQGREKIPLKDEIIHIENYLYIQQVRYKDRLEYEIQDVDEFSDYIVPKICIQPLVENAIYHGIKSKLNGGKVSVSYRIIDNTLNILVSDNGIGMDQQTTDKLNSILQDIELTKQELNFGLYYIQQRIRLYYGNNYGLHIESEKNIGTCVTIKLPLEK